MARRNAADDLVVSISIREASTLCSWSTARRPGSIWANHKFGWPFGRIAADDARLTLSASGPLGAVYSQLTRSRIPAAVPLAAIERIEVGGRRHVTAVIRSADPRFESAMFSARRAKLQPILDRLASAGVEIVSHRLKDLSTHR
jgi:hypothetical protein